MLQELASAGTAVWAVASLLFFVAVYAFVTVRVFTTKHEDLDAKARLVLDDAGTQR